MNYSNEITMIYKINTKKNNNKLQILGKCFIENNKECKIVYENKVYEFYKLSEGFNLQNIKLPKDNILKLKLIGLNKVKKINCIFNQVSSLISLPDIHL